MHLRHITTTLVLAVTLARPLGAQNATVDPPELYSDKNEITITDPNGIREIVANGGPLMTIEGAGPGDCQETRTLDVFVNTASQPVFLNLAIVDCKGGVSNISIPFSTVWTLDVNDMGSTRAGTRVCKRFSVRANGTEPIILDDITVDDPDVTLELPTSLPIEVPGLDSYVYTVCYDAPEEGEYRFPVITWIRRRFPSAGMKNYPVADTGFVRVLPPLEVPLTDPTTFRSIGIPNAVLPKRGRLYLGVYDLLGLTAGYAFDDHFMVIAGGALPTPDDWGGINREMFGAYSIGVKIGVQPAKDLHLAGGYQYGKSIYDREETRLRESEIRIHAPYLAASYGDDDRRVSVTGGYVFKHHWTRIDTVVARGPEYLLEYDQDAGFAGVGGDWRVGRHWKVTGETAYLGTAGVLPVAVGVRYFGERFAIDGGIGYAGIVLEGGSSPAVPVIPFVAAVVVLGK